MEREREEEGQQEAPDPARVALETRRAGLRKGLKIFEERWRAEHGCNPSGSDDIPFHIRAQYREYADLKRQLVV